MLVDQPRRMLAIQPREDGTRRLEGKRISRELNGREAD
jgi:hypothetical protein